MSFRQYLRVLRESLRHGRPVGGGPRRSPAGRRIRRGRALPSVEHLEVRELLSGTPSGGFTPAQIVQAYGINAVPLPDNQPPGANQTIAVVVTGDNPHFVNSTDATYATSDLAVFDRTLGIPDPQSFSVIAFDPTRGKPTIRSNLAPTGSNDYALAVEWAHAIAPAANLVVVEEAVPSTGQEAALAQTLAFTAELPNVEVVLDTSLLPEVLGDPNQLGLDASFAAPQATYNLSTGKLTNGHNGVTFVVGSGNEPGANWQMEWPAVSPKVISVGATSLSLSAQGTFAGERAWASSQGGDSANEPAISYQETVSTDPARAVPDVAAIGSPNTDSLGSNGINGVDIYNSAAGGWTDSGGTGASAAIWAGMIGIADQLRTYAGWAPLDGASQTLPRLYQLSPSDFNQITTVDTVTGLARNDPRTNPTNLNPRYNLYTGLGSPIANLLIPDLAGVNQLDAFAWRPIGPQPEQGGPPLTTPYSGRISAIAASATDPNVVYIAAAGGGVWKTTDATDPSPVWTPLTDNQQTLTMGALAIAPSNPNVIYAGTGEPNPFLADASFGNYGVGILVSQDGGNTWTLTATEQLKKLTVSKIVVDPTNANIAYAAVGNLAKNAGPQTGTGVFKTTDGGMTWTNMTTAISTVDPYSDVAIDPDNPDTLYTAVAYPTGDYPNGVYKSTDAGQTWTLLSGLPFGYVPFAPPGVNPGRVALAISPSNPQIIYASIVDAVTQGLFDSVIWRSSNGGRSWFTISSPDFIKGYGIYDDVLGVSPNNPNIVFAGGSAGADSLINFVSPDNGTTWTVTDLSGTGVVPFPFHHGFAFDANGNLLDGSDGGIFRLDSESPLTWSDLNGNLNIANINSVATSPFDPDQALLGTQMGIYGGPAIDGGVYQYNYNTSWLQTDVGDGGVTRYSSTNPSRVYHQSPIPDATGGGFNFFMRSDDGGVTWQPATNNMAGDALDPNNYYQPFVVDPKDGDHVLFGTDHVWETISGGDQWVNLTDPFTSIGWNPLDTPVDAIGLAASDSNTIYAATGGTFAAPSGPGTGDSQIFVTTNHGATWVEHDTPEGSGRVTDLEVDPNNAQIAYAVVSKFAGGELFRTTDGGVHWVDITGNLPQLPAWKLALDPTGTVLYLGMDDGVYISTNLGGFWERLGTGLPHAQVLDLTLNAQEQILTAGTNGRGAWQLSSVDVKAALAGSTLQITGGPLADTAMIQVRPNFPNQVQVFANTNTLIGTFPIGSFNSIAINGGENNNTVTVNFANGNPIPAGGLSYDGGTPGAGNRLALENGSFTNETWTSSALGSGTMTFNNGGPTTATISFADLAEVDDTLAVQNETIATSVASQAVTLADQPTLINGGKASLVTFASGGAQLALNLGAKGNLAIDGSGGNDTFTVNDPTPAGITSLVVDGNNPSGSANSYNFVASSAPATINGGAGNDTVNLGDGTTLAGITHGLTVNGQGGTNTLNATNDSNFALTNTSLVAGTANVALSSIQVANLAGGAGSNLFTLTGWTGGGTINGKGGTDTIAVTNDASFTLSGSQLVRSGLPTLALANLEAASLTSGPSNNTFDLSAWTGPGTLTGGGGSDTVTVTRDASFTLSDTQLALSDGTVLSLSGIGTANLTDGPSANTFVVSNWTGTGSLDGAGGTDTLVASGNNDFTLGNTFLARSGHGTLALTSIEVANLAGGAGNNNFDLSTWTGTGSLTGGGGSDTVSATKDTNFTLTNTSLVTGDGMSMALGGVRAADLTSGPSADQFLVSGWTGSGALVGGGGSDTVTATKSTNFTLTDNSLVSSDGMSLALSAVRTVDLSGGTGNDLFDVSGWTGAGTLTGGGGSDTLTVTKDTDITLANTSLTTGDGLHLALNGFGTAILTGGPGSHNFDVGGWTDIASVTGGGGADTISATNDTNFTLTDTSLTASDGLNATLAGFGTAALTGGPGHDALDVSGWSGNGTVFGVSGTDTLVASNNVDFTLSNSALVRSGLPTMTLSNISTVDLTSGPGNHIFDVTNWTGSGTLTAGGGTDTITATKDANFSLSNTALTSSDGMNLTLSGFATADLTGGPSNNLFAIGVWSGNGTLNGGGGTDTLTVTKDFNITLKDGLLTSSDGTSFVLNGIRIANLSGGPSNNVFDVSGWTGGGSLDGVSGTDTLVASNNVDFTLSNAALIRSGLPTLGLANIAAAALTSGPANHLFDVSGWTGGGTLSSGGGSDTLTASRDTSFTLGNTSLTAADGTNLTLSGFVTALLTGGPDPNNFDVSRWTGNGTITGGGGSDTVSATKDTNFTLTNTSLVTGDGMSLTLNGIADAALTGGPGNNAFNVIQWTGGGTLTGGGGSDTVTAVKDANFSLSNTALTSSDGMGLTLSGIGTADLTGGPGNNLFAIGVWSGNGTVTGGGGSDTVTVTKDFNITLTDTSLTSSDGTSFVLNGISAADLTGGTGNHVFDVSGWSGAGSLTGGGGTDTVVASNNVDFTLGNSSLVRSGLPTLSLSGIKSADLTTGPGNHGFVVSGWTGTGTLAGGGGSDTVTAAQNTDFTLTNGSLSAGDGMSLALSGIGTAVLTGGPGNNNFDVSGWTGTGTLSGGGGSDTISATKDANFTLTNGSLSTSDTMSLALNGIGSARLTGGPGNNAFDVSGWTGGGTVAGGGGSDTIAATKNANFSLADTVLSSGDGMNLALSAVGTANLTAGPGNILFAIGSWSGTGSLTGGGGSDTVTMTKDTNFTLADSALTGPGGLSLALSGIRTADLTGGPGNNVFDVSGWSGAGALNGVSGNDTVVASNNTDFTLSATVLGRAGLPNLSLANINGASLTGGAGNNTFAIGNFAGNVSITGGGGTDTVAVTRDANFVLSNSGLTTSDGLSVSLNGVTAAGLTGGPGNNTFDVSGWTGAGTLAGGGGSDTVTATRDTSFTLADTALTTSDGMDLALSGIGTANLTGGPSANTFDVSGWSGAGSLDGQSGSDTVVAGNNTDFTLSNTALGRSGLPTLFLANIEAARLTGGAGNHTFDVSGWTGTGTLTSGAGSDTVSAGKNASFSLANGSLTTSDGMALTLSGIGAAALTDRGTSNAFDVGGWTGTGVLTGSGSDTVTATKDADFTLANTALGSSDGMSLALSGFSTAALTTGPDAHTFTVSGWTGGGSLTATSANGTVAATKNADFTLANASLKTTDGMLLSLGGVTTANLTAGPGDVNTFSVSGWTGGGTLTGNKADTVSAAKDVNFSLSDTSLLTSDGMSLTLNGLGIANLTGGKSGNLFNVGGWTGQGSLTGGGGSDSVSATRDTDFSLGGTTLSAADGLTLALNGIGTALLTGGAGNNTFTIGNWAGAVSLTGGGGSDTVAVTRNASFTLANTALTTSDGLSVGLSGIANADLTGGSGANTFDLSGWTGGGSLTGGGGSDTLTATRDTSFTLSNTQLTSADGTNVALSGIGTAKLIGGPGPNNFDVSGWTGPGSVTGGGGSDTVSATKDANFTLANGTLTSSDGMSLVLAAIGAADLTGGPDPNSFDVSKWTGTGVITGVNGNDTVVANKNANFTLSDTGLSTGDGMNLALSAVSNAALTAGAAPVAFDVGGWSGGGSLTGGGGSDTVSATKDTNFTLSDTALTAADGLNLALGGIATAALTGGPGNNNFDVSGWSGGGSLTGGSGSDTVTATDAGDFVLTNSGLARTGRQTLALSGIGAADLTGGGGDNTFDVSGWTGAGLLNGGLGGGTHRVLVSRNASFGLSDSAVSDSAGLAMGLNHVPVAVLIGGPSANTFSVGQWTGAAYLDGASGSDTFVVAFKGSGSGTVNVADSGAPGLDTLIVTGTRSFDTITVTGSQITRGGETVTYTGIENEVVHGGPGGNAVNVNVAPGSEVNLTVDGGTSGSSTLSVTDLTGVGVVHGSLASGQASVHYLGAEQSTIQFANVQRLVLNPSADESYVQSLIIDVMGRLPMPGEAQPLVGLLDSPGGGRNAVVRQLELSAEGRLHTVVSWYQQYMGAQAGPYIEASWAGRLRHNKEEVVLSKMLAPLFPGGRGRFLEAAGQALFGRPLTRGELRRFGRAFAGGRSAALLAMLRSQPYRIRLVTSYMHTLFRIPAGQPLSPDLLALANQLAASRLDQRSIRILLETSDNFYAQG